MIQKLLKKTSILLLLSCGLSLLAPIASYAMDVTYFWYQPASGWKPGLSGYVYTKDPSSVSVSARNNDSTVTQVTYKNVTSNFLYDDNNTPYSLVELTYSNLQNAPISVSVGVDGQTSVMTGIAYSAPYQNYYSYLTSLQVANLGTYRMPGQFLASTVTAATYLPAGSEIVSFTPSRIGNAEGNGIVINLPYNGSAKTTFDSSTIALSDFQIIDQTPSVTSSVYLSGFIRVPSDGKLAFNLSEPLVQGHQYLVKLSSTSSGNEIKLPAAGNFTASVNIGLWKSYIWNSTTVYYLEEKNGVYFRNLAIGSNPGNGSLTPPSSSPATPETINPPGKDQLVVNEEILKNGTKDKLAVNIAGGKKQVLLPAKAVEIVGSRNLELTNDQLSVAISPEILKKLQSLVSADKLGGAQLSFAFDPMSESDKTDLLNKAKGKSNTKVNAAGDVYEFKLSVITSDGKETLLSQFDQPITLKLKVRGNANPALLGIYYIADDGTLEYVGGKLVDGEMVADIHHFSKYAVIEYNKTFDDVSDQYWASAVIKELTAKHIVNGASESKFAPEKQMTRAEFAALISRTLGLKASKAATFADVDSSNVFANAIAAASEAGIIQGRSAKTFASNDWITREEMATMIVKAFEYKSGKTADSSASSAYSDRKLAEVWAQPYIDAATSIGFIKGRGNGTFAPKKFMTRAEGAQIIYQLLKSN